MGSHPIERIGVGVSSESYSGSQNHTDRLSDYTDVSELNLL